MSLFVPQWLLWRLERSTEDHVGPVGGPVLWQLDWLWQSLGRSEERLDQPCDQQVRPWSVLTVKSTPRWGGRAHRCTLKRCCHFSMLDATRCAAQKCSTCSPCPIQRPVCRREPALHWPITLLSQEQALLMHCWHVSTLKGEDETIRQWCLIKANF